MRGYSALACFVSCLLIRIDDTGDQIGQQVMVFCGSSLRPNASQRAGPESQQEAFWTGLVDVEIFFEFKGSIWVLALTCCNLLLVYLLPVLVEVFLGLSTGSEMICMQL
jgi:hypothetical protein